ncbi:MAG: inositol monophosphatase, partial [Pseudomonadota bacterium]
YLHGGQKLWDYAAASLVLSEAGGYAMTLDGEPVFQAGLAPRSVIASMDAGLFRDWVAWLGVASGQ